MYILYLTKYRATVSKKNYINAILFWLAYCLAIFLPNHIISFGTWSQESKPKYKRFSKISTNFFIKLFDDQHKSTILLLTLLPLLLMVVPKHSIVNPSLINPSMNLKYALEQLVSTTINCHKLYSAISPSNLWWFPWSQWHLKALGKTFW